MTAEPGRQLRQLRLHVKVSTNHWTPKKRSSNHKVIYKEAFYVQEEATISDKTTYNFLKWMKKKSFKLKKIDKNKRESIFRKP